MNKLEFKIVNSGTMETMFSTDCTEELKAECKKYVKIGVNNSFHIEAWDCYTLIDKQEINVYFEF